ncbi:hypothetical protein ACLESO_41450, partial [Pyxidicoccus sp. 3LG]
MDVWRFLLAPLYATCLSALVVVAFAFGRRDPAAPSWRLPLVWFGLLAVGSFCVALQFPGRLGLALPTEAAGKALERRCWWSRR